MYAWHSYINVIRLYRICELVKLELKYFVQLYLLCASNYGQSCFVSFY